VWGLAFVSFYISLPSWGTIENVVVSQDASTARWGQLHLVTKLA
jgi:hypothetical protein